MCCYAVAHRTNKACARPLNVLKFLGLELFLLFRSFSSMLSRLSCRMLVGTRWKEVLQVSRLATAQLVGQSSCSSEVQLVGRLPARVVSAVETVESLSGSPCVLGPCGDASVFRRGTVHAPTVSAGVGVHEFAGAAVEGGGNGWQRYLQRRRFHRRRQ